MCKVSVVIPYYNSKDTILRALYSVISQTFKDYEIILVDDGSIDNSHRLVDSLIEKYPDIKFFNIYQNNMGPSWARNNGIKMAKGEYIAFLDSDDEWLPEKLERQILLMEANDIDMLGCNYYLVKDNIKSEFSFVKERLKEVSFIAILFKHYYATPCVVVKREVIAHVGLFPETQNFMEDAYVFTNIARKYRAYMIADFLVNIYKLPYGDNGLSGNIDIMEKYELLNIKRFREENNKYDEKLGIFLYFVVKFFSVIKYIKRKVELLSRK
jgi:glycosyltransferase involved in cell wall biosynthesis